MRRNEKNPRMQKLILIALFSITFLSFTYIKPSSSFNGSKGFIYKDNSLNPSNFEDSTRRLYNHMKLASSGLPYSVFRLGMIGYHSLKNSGVLNERNLLTIIDFTKPSTEKRFYTIDLVNQALKFHTYVAHGRNTGENIAKSFSNKENSNQSSLGFYVTGETYVGSKGFSLRLDGQDPKYNSNIRARGVVMHSADYVSETWIKKYGRLGRSQGCPALPKEVYKDIINTIKDGSLIFAYYKDDQYLTSSKHLNYKNLMEKLEATSVVAAP